MNGMYLWTLLINGAFLLKIHNKRYRSHALCEIQGEIRNKLISEFVILSRSQYFNSSNIISSNISEIRIKIYHFPNKNMDLKSRLKNGSHFVAVSICLVHFLGDCSVW